jgi:CheY-like chemotaxis protein/class 3 adenylate cyclase
MNEAATILVVDDMPQNVRLLEAVLTGHGYTVLSASSGTEALEVAKASQPDLVLLDIQMPEMNGYEVCRRLREEPASRFLPVVMITSSGNEERLSALDAGADDFITKPFNQAELLARARSLVRIKQFHDTIQTQAAELEQWNLALSDRVKRQVDELQRLGRLRRFLSPHVAEAIVSDESVLDSHRREIAALFCDLRGWTAFTASTEPEEVMSVIREFHLDMGELIHRHDATVGFLQGDGIMVWFNDPVPTPNPAVSAVKLALDMREAMTHRASHWRKRGHQLDFGVGIALGYATIGRIGFEGRFDYGAVGSVMNMASRLSDEAKGAQILIDARTNSMVEAEVKTEPCGPLMLKGFGLPVDAYTVIGG